MTPAEKLLNMLLKAHRDISAYDIESTLKAMPEAQQREIIHVAMAVVISRIDIREELLDGIPDKKEKIHEC